MENANPTENIGRTEEGGTPDAMGETAGDAEALRREIEALGEKLAKERNISNLLRSAGALSGNSEPAEAFFTREQVLGMSRAEIMRNLSAIERSQKYWK